MLTGPCEYFVHLVRGCDVKFRLRQRADHAILGSYIVYGQKPAAAEH